METTNKKTPRVLVVEDSDDLREIVCEVLKSEGYEVICLEDGRAAIKHLLCENCLPDIIITDLNMPHVTGQELVAVIRALDRTRELPVLVYSGSLYFEEDPRLVGCLFIKKPFSVDALILAIKSLKIISTTTIVSNGGYRSVAAISPLGGES